MNVISSVGAANAALQLPGFTRPRVQARLACSAAVESSSNAVLEKEYEAASATLEEKAGWQAGVRSLQGRRKHRLWEPVLQDPPPLLCDVCVVLVSPKRPISVGTVARALSCFECEDLRIVQPRCDHLTRSSRNGSKGAQFLLWSAAEHGTLRAALADADFSIACTRWVAGRPNAFRSITEMLADPRVAALLQAPASGSSSSGIQAGQAAAAAAAAAERATAHAGPPQAGAPGSEQQGVQQQAEQRGPRRPRLALVFGREVEGLVPDEVDLCDATLSIPIGRLQESMSLSHAVSVVLSRLFEVRQQAGGFELPQGVADLAAGYQDSGVER